MAQYKYQRRDKKRQSKMDRMPKSGKGLGEIYKNSQLKHAAQVSKKRGLRKQKESAKKQSSAR